MAKIDSFQSAFRPRAAARRRRSVAALTAFVMMLTGVGAIALSVQRTPVVPAEEPAVRQAVATLGAGTTATAIGEPGTPVTPAKASETDVTPAPARPGAIRRASKADPLLVQRPHRLAAASPRIEPAAPIAATPPAVARKPPQGPPPPALDRSATRTASIGPAAETSPEAEAAESETANEPPTLEPAALEPATLERAAPEPRPEAADPVPQPAPKPVAVARQAAAEASRTAPVVDDVNMRAGPSNGASVITVVPSGTQVEVIDCDYWCKVDYSGKRGWIYKSFIRGAS